jgi:two-component system response regulator FixJ
VLPKNESSPSSIYVIDDDSAVRESLEWLMTSVNLPVQTFESAESFLEKFDGTKPGCIVTDVRMPMMSGLELQREMAEKSPDIPVIIVTGHGELEMAVDAMKDGAFDFIQKPYKQQEMLDTVQKAVRASHQLFLDKQKNAEANDLFNRLSKREEEVLEQIVNGEPNKRIAGNLDISEKTVEFHRARIMDKLEARSLAELIKKAVAARGC